jgi:hypothetical protein
LVNANGQIQIQANDQIGSHSVQLTGIGAQLRWYTQRDSGPALRSIAMRNTSTGIAVGDSGTLLTTVNAEAASAGPRASSPATSLCTMWRCIARFPHSAPGRSATAAWP